MIETLFELVKASGVDRMNLSIQSSQGERATVCIQCILGEEPKDATDEQRELRQALAKPIVVEGMVGEVDAKLDDILTGYVRAAAPLANELVTNVEQVKGDLAKADKKVSKAKAKAAEKPKTATVSAEEGLEEGAEEEQEQEEEFDPESADSV
jgi:PRTRC genetic system protein E